MAVFMKVWLVQQGEPTPVDQGFRLMRTAIFANYLAKSGHDVTWWNSTFFHQRRMQRFDKDTSICVSSNYDLRFIHSPGYKKSVGLQRLRDHRVLARRTYEAMEASEQPDAVVCSYPPIQMGNVSTQYGRKHSIPVVVDVRDLWPDVFLDSIPKWTRFLAKLPLRHYFKMSRSVMDRADAVIGNSPDFVKWAQARGSRVQTDQDRFFPFGYPDPKFSESEETASLEFWKHQGIFPGQGAPILCFFGTLGYQFEFNELLASAQELLNTHDARFVLCGDGPRKAEMMKSVQDEPRILFPGWVDAGQIWTLMKMSQIGLAPYNRVENFQKNIANKPIEYLAGGLPVAYSISSGYLADLLQKHNCGVVYGLGSPPLSQRLRELLDDRSRLQVMSHNARHLYETMFRADLVYGSMVEFLEDYV
jgi:glycosyltransferase involved in cell wall biosynthesis